MNPPVTTILGIDQALRHTGVARWRNGRLSTQTIHTNPDNIIEERMRWTVGNIWPLITRQTFVVLETPFISGNAETSMALAGLYYNLRYGLYARGVPFGCIRNQHLKQFATGHGNADKAAMVQMAAATFGPGARLDMGAWHPRGAAVTDVDAVQHEADALWAMTAGLYHTWVHGWLDPVRDVTMQPGLSDAQVAVYDKVSSEWPHMDWEAPR